MPVIFKLLLKYLLSAWNTEKSMLGESRFDRESRRYTVIGILILLLLAVAGALFRS
ncbi:hypothetical protein [Prosthecobacter fluviatilis]|uniref:Uncharacterized protein n=1 Tax=Prosthecobacter fluviatilis TaxID=445931 RepID=A0ABW0KKI4_9BACT